MNLFYEDVEVEEEVNLEDLLSDIGTGNAAQLIVYNDDVNSFDWVIDSFTEVLQHTHDQAEQLALIIHYKGKATVKTASLSILKPHKDALVDRGLSAVIEGGQESSNG
jgi:ATP-dependent Clp protease adaptor protein ClpS